MVVNTEWGAFGEKGELDFIRTKWDYNVDKFSVNPTQHIFEKMMQVNWLSVVRKFSGYYRTQNFVNA